MSKLGYVIGTRGSKCAILQTRQVVDLLRSFSPDAEFAVRVISSAGDDNVEKPIAEFSERGVFTSVIEQELLAGHIDFAVHSAKDLPAVQRDGLTIGAYTQRVDPREALISKGDQKLSELPAGAIIGTSSPRRRFHLGRHRSDLTFKDIRGNVDSRLKKIRDENGQYQGAVVACAGLIRLGLIDQVAEIFSLDMMLPAAGQGALAVQCRSDDLRVHRLLKLLNHQPTAQAVSAEQAVLRILEAGCSSPIGVYADFPISTERGADELQQLCLRASLYDEASGEFIWANSMGSPSNWKELAGDVARQLRAS